MKRSSPRETTIRRNGVVKTPYTTFNLRKAIQADSVVALRFHEVLSSDAVVVTENRWMCRLVPEETSHRDSCKLMFKLCIKSGDKLGCCRSVTGVRRCVRNDYYSSTGAMQHGSGRLQQVVAVQGWINLQRAVGRVLESVCRCFRNDLRPLLNRASRVADRTRHRRSIAIVVGQNIYLPHSAEGTAC